MDTTTYGTRWIRTFGLFAVSLAAMAALWSASSKDVLAAQMIYQNSTASFSASTVTGDDIGFGIVPMNQREANGANTTEPVLRAGFAEAEINGFCLAQSQQVPVLGWVTFSLTAGDGDPESLEIAADNLVIDVVRLRGDDKGVNLDGVTQIGVTTSDITTVKEPDPTTPDPNDTRPVDNPLGAPTRDGGAGYFGIDSARGEIFKANGMLYNAVIGGPGVLPNLDIGIAKGRGPQCGDLPLPS